MTTAIQTPAKETGDQLKRFKPARIYFEQAALEYPLGEEIYQKAKEEGTELKIIGSHNRVTGIPGNTPQAGYREAKKTLVVGVRKGKDFESCKPSAHFQLPLVTSCPGMCEYCYLNTTLGKKPYVRVYVNVDEILDRAKKYIEERKPELTLFEGAATSDPIPVEYLTGSLAKAIEFFGQQEKARFRFVTKFTDVGSLLGLEHNGHTRFRFSVNSDRVISRYERKTPPLCERVSAAGRVAGAGYPLGFIIAPIILYEGWQTEYDRLFEAIGEKIDNTTDITFEFITHRFTKKAKNNILTLFPNSDLPMEEEERRYKYGQFGYGKYVYPKESFEEIKDFMGRRVEKYFPQAKVEYFV